MDWSLRYSAAADSCYDVSAQRHSRIDFNEESLKRRPPIGLLASSFLCSTVAAQELTGTLNRIPDIGEFKYVNRYGFAVDVRYWPKADPEKWSFAGVKASAFEKSGH